MLCALVRARSYVWTERSPASSAWITLIVVVNLFGIVGLFMSEDSDGQALQELQEIYSLQRHQLALGTRDPVAGIGRLFVARTASKVPTSSLTVGGVPCRYRLGDPKVLRVRIAGSLTQAPVAESN